MPILAHMHQWSHTAGGLQCLLGPCTAFLSPATLQANTTNSTAAGNNGSHGNGNDDYQNAWKKSGGG